MLYGLDKPLKTSDFVFPIGNHSLMLIYCELFVGFPKHLTLFDFGDLPSPFFHLTDHSPPAVSYGIEAFFHVVHLLISEREPTYYQRPTEADRPGAQFANVCGLFSAFKCLHSEAPALWS